MVQGLGGGGVVSPSQDGSGGADLTQGIRRLRISFTLGPILPNGRLHLNLPPLLLLLYIIPKLSIIILCCVAQGCVYIYIYSICMYSI